MGLPACVGGDAHIAPLLNKGLPSVGGECNVERQAPPTGQKKQGRETNTREGFTSHSPV